MSEFRIFCIGLFVGFIVIAALAEPDTPSLEYTATLLIGGLLHGALVVACFGRRGDA